MRAKRRAGVIWNMRIATPPALKPITIPIQGVALIRASELPHHLSGNISTITADPTTVVAPTIELKMLLNQNCQAAAATASTIKLTMGATLFIINGRIKAVTIFDDCAKIKAANIRMKVRLAKMRRVLPAGSTPPGTPFGSLCSGGTTRSRTKHRHRDADHKPETDHQSQQPGDRRRPAHAPGQRGRH